MFAAGTYIFWDANQPFLQTDEFLYAQIVKEMRSGGDYLIPRFASIPHLTKPPLFYWLSLPFAASVHNPQVAMRLLPGLCFLAVLWVLYRLASACWSTKAGILADLIFCLCYDHLYNHGYKSGVMDGLVNLELAMAFWLNVRLQERPALLRWIGLAIGLTFMTKTVFVAIPLAITLLNLWLIRKEVRVSPKLIGESIGLAGLVAFPWFAAVMWAHGPDIIQTMLHQQIWMRAAGDPWFVKMGRLFGRSESWYVLQHYLVYGQPWSLFTWLSLAAAFRNRRLFTPRTRRALYLAAGWFVMVFGVFLLSRGRWCWYISSAYIPAALLLAVFFHGLMEGAFRQEAPAMSALTAAACFMMSALYFVNPFTTPAGDMPLAVTLRQQLTAAGILLIIFHLIRRRETTAGVAHWTTRWLRADAIVWLALGVVAFNAWQAFVMQDLMQFKRYQWLMLILAGALLGCLLRCQDPNVLARHCVTVLLIIAAGYLVAPLRFARMARGHPELSWMKSLIAQGTFERRTVVRKTPALVYSYIRLFHAFAPAYSIEYDTSTKTLTVARNTL